MNKVDHQTAVERSLRIKEARKMAGFDTVSDLCRNHPELPEATIRTWEAGTNAPLTFKGAARLVDALKKDKLSATIAWFLHGDPPNPRKIYSISEYQRAEYTASSFDALLSRYDSLVQSEINSFSEQANTSVCKIEDNAMEPEFFKGEIVCGYWVYGDDIKRLDGLNCIIEINRKQLCRKLHAQKNDRFSCYANCPTGNDTDLIENIRLERAAPIFKTIKSLKRYLKSN